jgi:hypothetical protein
LVGTSLHRLRRSTFGKLIEDRGDRIRNLNSGTFMEELEHFAAELAAYRGNRAYLEAEQGVGHAPRTKGGPLGLPIR